MKLGFYYGANILLYNHSYRDVIVSKWASKPTIIGEKDYYEIPCVLGANYGISLNWFKTLKGFEGLKMWGSLEPFLSLKSWLAGGKCFVMPSRY